MKNVKDKIIIVLILAVIAICVSWFISTKGLRAEQREYKELVRIANRQAVEIAIIEQTYKMRELKSRIAEEEQPKEK